MKKMHKLPVIFTGTAPTKGEIEKQSQEIIDRINNSGDIDPLKVATAMKALETSMGIIKKGISAAILEEAQKYEKSFIYDGHGLQIREAGARYDFTNCNDPVYNRLTQQMDELKEQIKKREAWLKAAPEGQTIVDDDTGEVHEIHPPSKTSTTTVAITLAK